MLVCFCFVFGSLFSWYFLFLVCFFVYFFALFSVLFCYVSYFIFFITFLYFLSFIPSILYYTHVLYSFLHSLSLIFSPYPPLSLSLFFLPHYSKSSFPDLKNYSSIFVYYFVILSLLQSAITINPTQWLSKIERKDRKNYIIPLFAINYIWIFFFLYTFLFLIPLFLWLVENNMKVSRGFATRERLVRDLNGV